MDRRGLPRESTQEGPWKDGTERLPTLTGGAAGGESQSAPQDERDAEAGWLDSVGSDLRSFLGIGALVIFVLPAIVLVLTLLGNGLKPVPIEKATARGGRNAIVHHDQPQGGGRNDHFTGRNGGSPGTDSEANGVGPTQQTASDQREAPKAQGATVTTAPATSSASASASAATSAAASPEPASSSPTSSAPATGSVAAGSAPATSSASPAASTAPATATQPTSTPAGPAPPASQQASSPASSAPPLAGAMPTPGDVPVGGVQGGVPADAGTYDPSK